MVDGMLWRTAGKSAHHADELVVPSLLMQFGDISHFKKTSGNSQRRILCPLVPATVSVPK